MTPSRLHALQPALLTAGQDGATGPGAELLSRDQGGFALSSFTAFGDEQNKNVQQ